MKRSKMFISALLVLALLSGCAGKTTATTASQPNANGTPAASTDSGTATDATTETATDDRPMEGNMYLTGLPIVKEKETFTILVDDGGTPDTKIMYPILEEQTNVKVDLLLFPYEIAKEKKNILINSGNYPDVIGGWIMSQDEILTDGMQEGLYIPVDELINKYAPTMQNILKIKGVKQTMTLPDGHMYTIPYVIKEPLVPFLPWINEKWLEAVGMQMPTTTDEFREVLRAFKTKDPNGNGKADEIPFTADKNNLSLGLLAGWWGTSVPQSSPANFAMVNGNLEFTATSDAYKESIKYLAGLYAEGLIDPEIFTQDNSQWKAKGVQGLYGCSIAYGPGDYHEGLKPGELTDYVALPVLKAPGVDKPVFRRGSYGSTVFKNQLAITDKAKNPATIIRYFDNVFDTDNSIQIQAGLFGKRLEKLGEGDYRYLDENKLTEEEREKYGWANMFTQSLPKFIPLEIVIKPAEGIPETPDVKIAADALYEPFLDDMPAKVWVAPEDAKRITVLQTDINNYIDQKRAEWVSNQADVEAEWDTYKAQLDKLGLQELITIRQKAQNSAPKE